LFVVSGKTVSEGVAVSPRYEAYSLTRVTLTPVQISEGGLLTATAGDMELAFEGETQSLAAEYVVGSYYTLVRYERAGAPVAAEEPMFVVSEASP
jgi:hypothetical protein